MDATIEQPAGRRARPRRRKLTPRVWREQALAEIAVREFLVEQLRTAGSDGERLDDEAARRIRGCLETARTAAARGPARVSSAVRGADVERAWGHIDAAEEALLHAAPAAYVTGQLPRVLRRIQKTLACDDPRRMRVEEIVAQRSGDGVVAIDRELVSLLSRRDESPYGEAQQAVVIGAIERLHEPKPLQPAERETLIAAFHAANCESRRSLSRVRSFRNMLLICAAVLALAVGGLALLGFANPTLAPLCFQPEGQVVCPTAVAAPPPGDTAATGQGSRTETAAQQAVLDRLARREAAPEDILLIELIGLIAASVAAAAALRNARGTSTPYGVPVAVAVLKLPTGALTAVLGLLLMRGQFVPGLSALDSPAQILAWAVLFGYAQQLFTRFVDQRAHSVLEAAGPNSRKEPTESG